jgi:hypothetical protein
MGSGCIGPNFLDLGTSWRWVVHFTPRPLYPRYPLDRRLGGPQELVWMIWRRENSWPYRDSNSDPSVVQPIVSRYSDYAIPAHKKKDEDQVQNVKDSMLFDDPVWAGSIILVWWSYFYLLLPVMKVWFKPPSSYTQNYIDVFILSHNLNS